MSTEPTGPASSVLVKICGLTDPAEAAACARAGADWIGLNFHEPSPRFVSERLAGEILAELPETAAAVGVFVNRPAEAIRVLARSLRLSRVQLHGDEAPAEVRQLADAGLMVIRAFRLRDVSAVDRMEAWLDSAAALGALPAWVLVDAYAPGVPGGTGRTIDAAVLRRLVQGGESPRDHRGDTSWRSWVAPRLILAGGLTPENVGERLREIRPRGVDVAGGVESAPGRKDPARVAALIAAVRTAEAAENRR